MVATAASMRTPKRRAFSSSSGRMRRAEGDGGPGPCGSRPPLGQDVAGAVQMDGHHRAPGALGQVGGATGERLAPPVGGTAAFGEDDQVPAVGQQPAASSAERRLTLVRSMGMAASRNDQASAFQRRSKK